jgi:hypothetical protein
MPHSDVTLCAIFRVPSAGLEAFLAYEDAVLPLLADHGGELQRRLRTADSATEIHLIRFPSRSHLDAYRADRRRTAHAELLTTSGAVAEVLTVRDVTDRD